jgi:hypothetical protein
MKTIITAKINIHYYLLSTSVKLSTQVYWSDKKKIHRAEKYSTVSTVLKRSQGLCIRRYGNAINIETRMSADAFPCKAPKEILLDYKSRISHLCYFLNCLLIF